MATTNRRRGNFPNTRVQQYSTIIDNHFRGNFTAEFKDSCTKGDVIDGSCLSLRF